MSRGSSTSGGGAAGWAGKRRGGGGRTNYFSKWKESGSARVWPHTRFTPIDVYRHGLPMCVVIDDKKTKEKVTRVFSKSFVCHETEETLDGQ